MTDQARQRDLDGATEAAVLREIAVAKRPRLTARGAGAKTQTPSRRGASYHEPEAPRR